MRKFHIMQFYACTIHMLRGKYQVCENREMGCSLNVSLTIIRWSYILPQEMHFIRWKTNAVNVSRHKEIILAAPTLKGTEHFRLLRYNW